MARLSRDRVLRTAVDLADRIGIDALSMRRLADELDVVPMALYKHVAKKEELLDGMVDIVIGEIDPPTRGAAWKAAFRQRILSARRALLRHPWAPRVLESRTQPTPAVLDYMDSMIGIMRSGGFSRDLAHHSMHAVGSRLMGFTQELFDDKRGIDPTTLPPQVLQAMIARYPNIAEMAGVAVHEEHTVVGAGCDDQFEFEFAVDILLDGLERKLAVAQKSAAG